MHVLASHGNDNQGGTLVSICRRHIHLSLRFIQGSPCNAEFVTDRMLLKETCYQMTSSFSKFLTKGKKNPRPTLPLTIGAYTVKDFREVEAKAEQLRGFFLLPLEITGRMILRG